MSNLYKVNTQFHKLEYEGSFYDTAIWLNGTSFKSNLLKKSGIPIIKIRELKDGITLNTEFYELDGKEKYLLKKGDLLYSWSGNPDTSLDAFYFDLKEGLLNQHIFKIEPKSFINTNYFYYLLKYLKPRLRAIARDKQTTGLGHITLKDLKELQVQIPTNDLQNKIVEILKPLDDKIELIQKMNENLEDIAKAIFKSWFIDFDPVKAKAEGKPTGLSNEISDLFPDSFEDSELGEIPKGWNINRLESVLDVLGGHAFKSKDYRSDGIFVLRTKNFNDGIASEESDDVFLPKTFLKSHEMFICEAFDYHLVMVGASIGKTGMILPSMLPAFRNQNMWCFRPKHKEVSRFFTKFVVDMASKRLSNFSTGSARDFFRKEDFRSYKLVFPTNQILNSYSSITNSLLEKFARNYEQNTILANLRDTLLPKLISGELRIKDADKFIEKAGI